MPSNQNLSLEQRIKTKNGPALKKTGLAHWQFWKQICLAEIFTIDSEAFQGYKCDTKKKYY